MAEQLAASEGSNNNAMQMLETTGNTASEYFNQTLNLLEQFLERMTLDDEKTFVENLLWPTRDCERQIQDA